MLLVGLLVIAAAGSGYLVAVMTKSPGEARSELDAPPPAELYEVAQSGPLTSSISFTATVSPGDSQEVKPLAAPDAVVTAGPEIGREVSAGSVLIEINDRPVIALTGEVPLYRDLTLGDRGDDVERLQNSLIAAGYQIRDSKGRFGSGTASALSKLYSTAGFEPPQGGGPGTSVIASQSELQMLRRLPATISSSDLGLGAQVADATFVVSFEPPLLVAEVNPLDAGRLQTGASAQFRVAAATELQTGGVVSVGAPSMTDAESGYTSSVVIRPDQPLDAGFAGQSAVTSR